MLLVLFQVCRHCLNINVYDKTSDMVVRICSSCATTNFPTLFPAPSPFTTSPSLSSNPNQRVSYNYGLDGPLTPFSVKFALEDFSIVLLQEGGGEDVKGGRGGKEKQANGKWVRMSSLSMSKLHVVFDRFEDNQKLVDVGLYAVTIGYCMQDGGFMELVGTDKKRKSSTTGSSTSSTGSGLDTSANLDEIEMTPQIVYRYNSSSIPQEPSIHELVVDDITVYVLWTPLHYIIEYFTKLVNVEEEDKGEKLKQEEERAEEVVDGGGEEQGLAEEKENVNEGGMRQPLRRVKIMVHKPRIVLPEDGNVSRGLTSNAALGLEKALVVR